MDLQTQTKTVNLEDLQISIQDVFNKGYGNIGVCSTAAGTATKEVTLGTIFSLVSGATVLVKFTYGITVANATLAITHTPLGSELPVTETAKPIYLNGAALEAKVIPAGAILILRYNGTQFDVVGGAGVGAPEVEIGETAPEDDVKLFVDEDDDPPASFDVYTREQTDGLLDGKVSNPIELTSLSGDYTFSEGDTIVVGTGLYKCTAESTPLPPFNFVFDANGSIVIDSINGYEAVVVDSDTLNTGWEKVAEISDRHYIEMRVNTKANKATTLAGYNIGDAYTKTQIDALTRHTRLMDFDLNVLKKAVADQNLEKYGLKVGDEKTINGHTYVIAGLNPFKGTGNNIYRVATNHVGLIVIPHTAQKWNESNNTYTGADSRGEGYINSDLHYYLKNTLLPLVNTDIGASNIIGHSKQLSSSISHDFPNRTGLAYGGTINWTREDGCKICALSEVQVYGSIVWSSSGYDTGEACHQLEVFKKYTYTEIFLNESIWLRDVVSESSAACAYNNGIAHRFAAAIQNYVAALILFH